MTSRRRRHVLMSAGAVAAVAAAVVATTAQADDLDWQLTDLPTSNDGASVMAINGSAADDVWSVGSYYPSDGSDLGMSQHWDGQQWNEEPVPGAVSLRGVDSLDASNAWAVGGEAGKASALRWDGSQWEPTELSDQAGALDKVEAVADDDVWALGHKEIFEDSYVEHWDGTQWSVVDIPEPEGAETFYLHDLTAIAADDIWAVGDVNNTDPLVMHWDGESWSDAGSEGLSGALAASTAVDDTLWVLSDDGKTNNLSHRDGDAWTTVESDADYMTAFGLAPDGDGGVFGAGWLQGEGGKLMHSDGDSITVDAAPKEGDAYLRDIARVGDTTWVLGASVDGDAEVPYAAYTS